MLLQQSGEILYNGEQLDSFVPERTAVYVDQSDLSIPDMTVREVGSNMSFASLGTTGHAIFLDLSLSKAAPQ